MDLALAYVLPPVYLRVSDCNPSKRHLIWLWDQFKYADKDNSGVLHGKEIDQFFESINLPLDKDNRAQAEEYFTNGLKSHLEVDFS